MDRRRLVAAAVVVGLLALAGCNGPTTKTEVVCDDCVGAVTETASETNRSITVEESVTHVYLQNSGDARVEARMSLSGADADDLRVNESLLATVRRAIESGTDEDRYGYGDDGYGPTRPAFRREDLAVAMEGRELVVTFRVANLSERRLGATLSDYFFRADGDEALPDEVSPEDPWEIGTDRLVVHGPGGTEPLIRPAGATVEGSTLVWEGGETVDTRTYLLFGSGGPMASIHARIVVATEVFLWATPTAVFGAVVPTVILFCLTGILALRYPGYVDDGWDVRRDLLFWVLAGASLTLLATLAGFFLHSLVALALLVAVPVLVAVTWWLVRPEDAAILGSDEPVEGQQPDAPAGDGAAGSARVGERSEPGDTTESVVAGLGPGQRTLVATAGSLAAVLVVTAVVAADYRATVTGPVAIAAGIVPFVAFPTLGYAVTLPGRADLRSALVVATAAAPWLAAFPLSVQGGTETLGAFVVTILWGFGALFVGLALFYGVLWVATRRS